MELRHLRYFVAVAEELHFGRAARRLHIAQPPLSQQIKAFEDELGVKLFERSRRKVELSEAGRLLLDEARKTLTQAAIAAQVARDAQAGKRGRLRVAFVLSASYTILPELLRRFRADHPGIELQLSEMSPARQMASLDADDIDAGLLRLPVPETCYLVTTLLDEPLVAAVPREHPLARGKGLHLRQLATEPLVLFHRSHGPGIYDAITRACDAAGFTPTPVHEANEMQTILSYVAGGLGVSLVPCSLAQFHRPDIAYLPLKSPRAVLTLAAVTKQGPPKQHVLNFLATAKTIGGEWKKRLPSLLGIREES